jgi:hypothetical protein
VWSGSSSKALLACYHIQTRGLISSLLADFLAVGEDSEISEKLSKKCDGYAPVDVKKILIVL